MTSRITIVGGGYAGAMLARSLDDVAQITLVEPRDKWVHNVAMIRAMATPQLLDQIVMPYDGLLKNGKIVRSRVTAIDGTNVILEDGGEVAGDLVIVATGSSYAAPFKMQSDESSAFISKAKQVARAVDKSKNIAIVGAGAVGCELAGEIAFARPEKQITLISSGDKLFANYPPKLGRAMLRQLGELGVKVRLGEHITKLKRSDEPYVLAKGKLKLSDGFPIDVDMVIPVVGAKPNTELMQSVEGVAIDGHGRIIVDNWLRPTTNPGLFVVGDIASTGDTMTIVGLTRQVGWLQKALKAHIGGKAMETQKAYKPWSKSLILLPLGPDKGASALPFGVTGPFLTSMIKGKKLFIPRYHKEFNWTP
ncbi:NAD(P)/FAD-dependent oxidoreductase [Parasphingorhabdus halotolerans]|uniref:FAD-dependent oxidoreductase n=1 Tax=Parasphingorhabdus halotolerans TaxID=2725558 RepID=A0A6H2DLY7_9SPHN|nr:FAD-dependent oxidoreductase [Parasphingorhabdus halotolerans]QJB69679.1 FAD-dependent oxidoreductase [Parasphingorhabdus halotolerans]